MKHLVFVLWRKNVGWLTWNIWLTPALKGGNAETLCCFQVFVCMSSFSHCGLWKIRTNPASRTYMPDLSQSSLYCVFVALWIPKMQSDFRCPAIIFILVLKSKIFGIKISKWDSKVGQPLVRRREITSWSEGVSGLYCGVYLTVCLC